MQVEVDGTSPTVNGTQMIIENDGENHENSDNPDAITNQERVDVDKQLTQEDLSLLCDLFYLPFEHGGQGIQLLQEFNWLKSNAHVVMKKSKEEESASESDVSYSMMRFIYQFLLLHIDSWSFSWSIHDFRLKNGTCVPLN